MLDLILVLSAVGLLFTLFSIWQNKIRQQSLNNSHFRHRIVSATSNSIDSCKSIDFSRQSRRFQECSLFGISNAFIEHGATASPTFQSFIDRFKSQSDVISGLRASGFDKCDLILGIDFTASNEWQGRRTFNRNSLHSILLRGCNPYQQVIRILCSTLEPFSDDGSVYAYGFGDQITKDQTVFSFASDHGKACNGFNDVYNKYNSLVRRLVLAGPTSYAPLLRQAMEIVKIKRNRYFILLIISDGQMNDREDTIQAIVDASLFPLSVIMIGVGDGPWDIMEEFDDFLPQRRFDNFQFVNFQKVMENKRNAEATFALHTLMEIPDQYKAIKNLGLL